MTIVVISVFRKSKKGKALCNHVRMYCQLDNSFECFDHQMNTFILSLNKLHRPYGYT